MKRSILSALVLAALAAPAALMTTSAYADDAAAAPPPSPFTGNMTLASEYLYRGIAQTRGKPALQGGFDYAHSSGFYVGTWASTISWIGDATAGASAPLEIDLYGGFRGSFGGSDLGYDVGVLTYNYPGSGKPTGNAKPDTTEIYAALSWTWLSVKYSRSTGSLFGWVTASGDKTSGSGYLEVNGTWDLGNGWGLTAHGGHQTVKGLSDASYSDYKIGVTKDVGFGTLGLAMSGTNAKDNCSGAAAATASDVYCFVNNNGTNAYSSGKTRAVLTFGKTF
ncbi:MAG: hypothetical protein EPO06_07965 [Burkholderiaceae bacterium]|nr:MAG: hypothetical protein EPO06_07965 [Burkholderiaceae bacterium]